MPLIDIELVRPADTRLPHAQVLADAIGRVLGSPPGRCWLRLRRLDVNDYAENGVPGGPPEPPVFVTVLHAHVPQGAALAAQARALTDAVAEQLCCSPASVHVQYAPPGAGRQAFGGTLLE